MGLGGWGWGRCRGIQREVVNRNTCYTHRWCYGACIRDKGLTLGGVRHLVDPNQPVADLEHVIPERPSENVKQNQGSYTVRSRTERVDNVRT